ncbi:hypothetical protein ABT404_51315, partial [Streptomyces hyaluromycini]
EPRRPLVACNLAIVATALPLLALAGPAALWAVVAAAFASGLALSLVDSLWNSSLQQLIPDQVLSRVNSYDWMLSTVAAPLGLALAGPLADRAGTARTLVLAAVMIIVPCSLTVLIPGVRAVRRTQGGRIVGPRHEPVVVPVAEPVETPGV